jgi:hypothetical protein
MTPAIKEMIGNFALQNITDIAMTINLLSLSLSIVLET